MLRVNSESPLWRDPFGGVCAWGRLGRTYIQINSGKVQMASATTCSFIFLLSTFPGVKRPKMNATFAKWTDQILRSLGEKAGKSADPLSTNACIAERE